MFLLRVEGLEGKKESFSLSSGTSTMAHCSRLKSPLGRSVSIFPAQQSTRSVSTSRVVLSPCPWFFALHREIITVIERTTHTALTQDVSQTLTVSWKQRKGQWMHRNASKCLHMSAPWKVLWIPAEKALSEGYLGILHHLRSQVYQQKAPRCSTQPTVDGSESSTGPCI